MLVSAITLGVSAALAWSISRREGAHRAFAIWATAMTLLELGRATQPTSAAVGLASAGAASLGLLGVCVWSMGSRRLAWAVWTAAVASIGAAHPDVSAAARHGLIRAEWVIAAGGTWLFIGRALRSEREPRLFELTIMFFAAAAVVHVAIPPWSTLSGSMVSAVPMTAGALAAIAAQAWWGARVLRAAEVREVEATDDAGVVGDGDVDVRGDERMGDLVDVAEALRRRREREARARGGNGEA